MSALEIGFLTLGIMLLLIVLGLHVAVALMLTSFIGVWLLRGDPALAGNLLALAASDSISEYVFGVIPLFVLMGLLVSESGIGKDTFDVAEQVFRRLAGGLGVATVGANAIFAAITGVSIASLAVFTKVAVPEMLRFGYKPRFAVGVVAGSSVLGMLIPPSLLLILFGILTETSIGDLFLAGVVPGVLLATMFGIGIVVIAIFAPRHVLQGEAITQESRHSSLAMLLKISPIVVLIVAVMGGIYGGFFTPTEAGAVGAILALILALLRRSLNWGKFWRVLIETGHVTATICILIIAATMYSRMLALSGVPFHMVEWIKTFGLGLYGTIFIYVLIVLVLGTILDSASIMLIMIPLMLPIMIELDVNLVWFGIITVISVEIGLLTPPLGLAVYILKGTLDDQSISLGDIFAGAAPFALVMVIVLLLIIAFPSLSLVLI